VVVASLAFFLLLILLRIAFRAWRAMHFQSRHDPLTGLANRRVFEHNLRAAVGGARQRRASLAVILLDLDHFKAVNDSFGHFVGDEFAIVTPELSSREEADKQLLASSIRCVRAAALERTASRVLPVSA
jgi:GGDEF domain-containing protein